MDDEFDLEDELERELEAGAEMDTGESRSVHAVAGHHHKKRGLRDVKIHMKCNAAALGPRE